MSRLPSRFERILHTLPALLLPLVAACATVPQSAPQPVVVGIAAFNDFHGALEPPKASVTAPDGKGGSEKVPAGGAAWLASAIDSVRAEYPNHLTLSAGDMIGASQLSSAMFLDEPSIGVMNRIGVDFNAVGNHEFDHGVDELKRIHDGGCAKFTSHQPCRLEPYPGANFPFLAANTIRSDGTTLFPAYGLKSFGEGKRRVTVGVIGLTLKETGNLTSVEGLKDAHFADEADTANALVPLLKAAGADAIVVLIHQGGKTRIGDPNSCADLTDGIRPILDRLDPRVDLVVSGHTHWAYVCNYGQYNPAKPFLLTSAGVYGELVTDIRLEIDPATHRVVGKSAHNIIVQSVDYDLAGKHYATTPDYPKFAPRADIRQFVQRYVDAASSEISKPAGRLAGVVDRPGGDASRGGGTLGNLIADAQLAATRSAGAEIAFMNPFGIRSPHVLAPGADGQVTFGQLYQIQPFTNTLVTQTMTGAELKAVLEQGLDDDQPVQFLSTSHGFTYSYDLSRPVGDRIVAMTYQGAPIDPAASYRITTNSFLAGGGDSFYGFAKRRDAQIARMTDLEALEAWLSGPEPRAVPDEIRAIAIKP